MEDDWLRRHHMNTHTHTYEQPYPLSTFKCDHIDMYTLILVNSTGAVHTTKHTGSTIQKSILLSNTHIHINNIFLCLNTYLCLYISINTYFIFILLSCTMRTFACSCSSIFTHLIRYSDTHFTQLIKCQFYSAAHCVHSLAHFAQ